MQHDVGVPPSSRILGRYVLSAWYGRARSARAVTEFVLLEAVGLNQVLTRTCTVVVFGQGFPLCEVVAIGSGGE